MSQTDGGLEERLENRREPDDREPVEHPRNPFEIVAARSPRPPAIPPPTPAAHHDIRALHAAYGNSVVARAAIAGRILPQQNQRTEPPAQPRQPAAQPDNTRRAGPPPLPVQPAPATPAPATPAAHPDNTRNAGPPPLPAQPAPATPAAAKPAAKPEQPPSAATSPISASPGETQSPASDQAGGKAPAGPAPAGPAPASSRGSAKGPPAPSASGAGSGGGRAGGPAGAKAGATPATPALDASSSQSLIRSLAAAPASSLAQAVASAETMAPQVQKREAQAMQATLPETPIPSGIPRRPAPPAVASPLGPVPAPETKPPAGDAPSPAVTPADITGPVPGSDVSTDTQEPAQEESTSWWSWLMDAVKNFLGRLPSTDSGVDTSAGPRPTLQLAGGADPSRMNDAQQKGETVVVEQKGKANAATTIDFGENDIGPTLPNSTARARLKSSPAPGGKGGAAPVPDLSPDARAAFDKAGAPIVRDKVDDQADRYADREAEGQKEIQSARHEAKQRMDDAVQQASTQQEGDLKLVRKEVSGHRSEWQLENEKVEQEYQGKAAGHRKDAEIKIDQKVRDTDKQVDDELTKAENTADKERKDKEADAARIKREAEEKPRGFWDRVKGAISSVFNAIKKAVTAVFDALRWLVKKIIEGAKLLVRGLIELARIFVVGLIEGFAALLKLSIKIALIAFPETAKKWCDAIDGAVKTTVDAVNSAAQWLKDKCDAILDFLGDVIDKLLHYSQVFMTTCLELVRLLATGQFAELWEKLKTLALALWLSLDYVEGEIYTQLIGFDLTQNLGPQLMGGEESGDTDKQGGEEDQPDPANLAFLLQDNIRDEQVQIDPVAELSVEDELLEQLNTDEGSVTPIGDATGPDRTRQGVVQDLLEPVAEPSGDIKEAEPSGNQAPDGDLKKEADALDPEMSGIIARAFTAKTRGERFGVVKDLMWAGIKQYWREKIVPNLWWIIPVAILAIAAVIVLEVLTEGAVTAVIAEILEIVAGAMLIGDIAKVAGHLADYLEKGMAGDKQGAARAFAKALATGIVAVLMLVLFEIVGKALKLAGKIFARAGRAVAKAAKAVVKGLVRIGRAVIKGVVRAVIFVGKLIIRLAKITGRMIARGAEFVLEKGRLFFKGLGSGFARGVEKLEEFFERLKGWFKKFHGFSAQVEGDFLVIYAEINPRKKIAVIPLPKGWKDYRETFFKAFPKLRGKVVVHHSIERQILTRYPGLFSEAELHALDNLRGIPKAANPDLHLSQIRKLWNEFYRAHPTASRPEVFAFRARVDKLLGSQFLPPR